MTHQSPAPKCASHTHYLLTCEDYDRLFNRAGGCCEICRITGPDTPHGMLHIDHDAMQGWGAVRGLLCSRCNTLLGRGIGDPDKLAAYLDRPLFKLGVRTPRELATGTSKQFRMPDDEWQAFRRAVGRGRVAIVLRQFIRWYIGEPGVELPERPPRRVRKRKAKSE